jgi:hypothetical protein
MYPNPLIDYTSIEFENSIHNITSGTVRVERKNLPSGLYFIRLRDEKEIRAFGKLAVE